jgi:Isochorismatase family
LAHFGRADCAPSCPLSEVFLPCLNAGQFLTVTPIDRTAINAWEDTGFCRRCESDWAQETHHGGAVDGSVSVHPALDAMKEGFEVYPVVDAVAGTSVEAHEAGLQRIIQAGAKPTSWVQLICELQRDWNRQKTVPSFVEILFSIEGH